MNGDLTHWLSYFRELNFAAVALRLTLALVFGGVIGMEREHKRRPAGFRTYMLVCLGAALTMLLNQYESVMLNTQWAAVRDSVGASVDVSRFGAQVINGIGFLGAGTILVTERQEVKGLTTAAGLWASACTGLAIGAGFYECMALSLVLVFLCVRVLPYVENAILERARNMNIYIELGSLDDIAPVIQYLKGQDVRIFDIDLERETADAWRRPNAVLSIYLPKGQSHSAVLAMLSKMESIYVIEEI